ncbi:hypothetical protein KO529_09970 [Arenibacter algicola]|uniref:hypothetical protein n=1 Tax=Arenibacter algicola TaxID=616991 RepID=UPI001C075E86|nr:hypothetical protein [Arenibacter algicola]MBU2905110.1 hypothetical protein [Arenibacter algicola]
MIEWINNKFGTDYSVQELDEIKDFTLIWNIFENTIFNARFSINLLEQEIVNRNPNFEDFHECFNYYQNRYVVENSISNRFQYLNFRRNDREQFVKDVLLGHIIADNAKVLAIGIIVYRLRNNLFHGLKNYRNLNGQVENFSKANTFIQRFLEI